jgi:hypothetical protein
VTTTGYGDLQGGSENQWYTDEFGGTSSASPIVVGALGCIQGIRRALRGPQRCTSEDTPPPNGLNQQAATGRPTTQRIGNRPNLREKVRAATGPACFDPEEILIPRIIGPSPLRLASRIAGSITWCTIGSRSIIRRAQGGSSTPTQTSPLRSNGATIWRLGSDSSPTRLYSRRAMGGWVIPSILRLSPSWGFTTSGE